MKHYAGKGCNCEARSYSECGCVGSDWRSAREVELEEKLKIAKEALKSIAAWLDHGDLDSPSKEALIVKEALDKIKVEK